MTDGELLGGYVPPDVLVKSLQDAAKEAAKAATAQR